MRKALFTTVVLAMVAFAALAWAEVRVIGPYPIGEFAIKGKSEGKINSLVAEIRGNESVNNELNVAVIGSADNTGRSVDNDWLAKARADQVAAVLSSAFPKAKINAWSKGEGPDAREVWVDYQFTPIPPPAPAKTVIGMSSPSPKAEGNNKIIWILPLTVGLAFAAVVILVLKKRENAPGIQRQLQAPQSDTVPAILKRLDPVEVQWEGRDVSIPLVLRGDGNVWTPFKNPENKGWIFRKDRELAKKAVKSFFKDAEGDERRLSQIRELVGSQN